MYAFSLELLLRIRVLPIQVSQKLSKYVLEQAHGILVLIAYVNSEGSDEQ